MLKFLRLICLITLWLTSINALYAGGCMMYAPSGGLLGLSLDLLQYTIFNNYFIPGIILFLTIGVSSALSALFLILKYRFQHIYLIVQGLLLGGWIVIQMLLIRQINGLHLTFIIIAILWIATGNIFHIQTNRHHS